MTEGIEGYLSGSINKPKIEKTGFDFLKEWINSIFTVKKLSLLVLALLGAKYALDFFGTQFRLPAPLQMSIGILLAPLLWVAIIILVVRTIGLVLSVLLPDIKAREFSIDKDVIYFLKSNGKSDSYRLSEVHNFILIYNYKGLLIHTSKGTKTYSLELEPKDIESRLDIISDFHKQTSSTQSREGNIRTVWYGNPLFVAENKSFTVTNEGLNNYRVPSKNKFLRSKHGLWLVIIGLSPFIIGLSFVGVGIYNSIFRIIPVYKTTFINEAAVSLPDDAYQKILGNTMQIVIEKNSEFGNYSGEIHSDSGDYNFNGYTYHKIKGGNYTLAGWIEIPKTKSFNLSMSPETKNPFTLTVNYIK